VGLFTKLGYTVGPHKIREVLLKVVHNYADQWTMDESRSRTPGGQFLQECKKGAVLSDWEKQIVFRR